MDNTIFYQEKTHLNGVLVKLGAAKKVLEASMRSIGVENLEKLKDMRADRETDAHDLFAFMERLHEKNTAFNFKDKYRRLDELESLLKEPYFSRLDLSLKLTSFAIETIYIGKFGYTQDRPIITDWRAKIASVYYRYRYPQKNITYDTPNGVEKRDLLLKRTFEVDNGNLVKYYNNDIQLDETEIIIDKIKSRTGGVLEDIVETIQESQLDIIEADPRQVCIVQGCVGSGKSTVAIHKLSHIFFNYPTLILPERSILVAKNQILVGYLSTLFPKLGIFDINYKSLRELIYGLVFSEELKLDIDFDIECDASSFDIKKIYEVKQKIKNIHNEYKEQLDTIFRSGENEYFAGFKYTEKQTIYNNISEVIEDMEEELDSETFYLKENPDSSKSYLYRNNIKVLKKIISTLRKLRNKLKETALLEFSKSLGVDTRKRLNYLETLIYLFIYSELVGIEKSMKYHYCVVDEGQDFSVLEYLILSKIVLNGRFCILGDLNQAYQNDSLTSWDEIQQVITEARQAQTFELDTNYRSTKPIIDLANKILNPFTNKFLPKSINRKGSDPKIINAPSFEEVLGRLKTELEKDVKETDKSIGIICIDESVFESVDSKLSTMKIESSLYVKLDSKRRITYIPNGVYLSRFEDCKGLEFSKVYVLGLDLDNIRDFKEAKRAFVAVTRAMNEVVIFKYAQKQQQLT